MRSRLISFLFATALLGSLVSVAASPVQSGPSSSRSGVKKSYPRKGPTSAPGPPAYLGLYTDEGWVFMDASPEIRQKATLSFGIGRSIYVYDAVTETVKQLETDYTLRAGTQSGRNVPNFSDRDFRFDLLDIEMFHTYHKDKTLSADFMSKSQLEAATGEKITDDRSYCKAGFVRLKTHFPLPQYYRLYHEFDNIMEKVKPKTASESARLSNLINY
ncbi:hypothetical protein F5878DRAFT_381774 [Lentinula raphanica]|uniref:Uncharacterized protein n=1 Tax=Lentinula raphanica TaxID=153919 RepID=A0AA38P0B5_9AGAR|nr:hypothetical protein F5878DRAFT_381774 [Lentinula raphanica]